MSQPTHFPQCHGLIHVKVGLSLHDWTQLKSLRHESTAPGVLKSHVYTYSSITCVLTRTKTNAAVVEFPPFAVCLLCYCCTLAPSPREIAWKNLFFFLSLQLYNTHISLATGDSEILVFCTGTCRLSSTHRSLENSSLISLTFNKKVFPS